MTLKSASLKYFVTTIIIDKPTERQMIISNYIVSNLREKL